MIGIAVIGAGIMGTDHARILHRDVPGCEVVGVSDIDLDRATAVADEVGAPVVTTDSVGLIHSPAVDAVLIATSDVTHLEYVHACLTARKPVLCEKPLAPTADECRVLVDEEATIVEAPNQLISVGFMRRFDSGYVELKALLTAGELGSPLMVHSVGRGVQAPSGSDELTVTGSAIHDIDIVPWLLDEPIAEVSWQAGRQSPEVADRRDPQLILLRSTGGTLITIDVFLNARYGYDIRCEIVGSMGAASLTEPHTVARDRDLQHGYSYAADWRPRFAEAYRLQSRAWVESLRRGTSSPLSHAVDGLRAALVADAVIASMKSEGSWISVPQVPA